jgi:DNA-binding response OmpR family regulator
MVLIEPILRCSALKTPSWTWALGFCGSVGGACRFPPKEFELLSVLLGHAGQVVHRERLLAAGWDNRIFGNKRHSGTKIDQESASC